MLGDTVSISRDATSRDVSGDSSGAFVSLGLASRVTVALRGFLVEFPDSAKSPAAVGVGVSGGRAAAGVVGLRCARFLGGVEGASAPSLAGGALRFRPLVLGAVWEGGSSLGVDCALMRAERLVAAIVRDVVSVVLT